MEVYLKPCVKNNTPENEKLVPQKVLKEVE